MAFIAVFLMGYGAGYLQLRHEHDLVHDATYYSDHGKRVRTDRVRVGEWRGPEYQALALFYLPARLTESAYWRMQP